MENKNAPFTITFITLLLLDRISPAIPVGHMDLPVSNPTAVKTDAASGGSMILLPKGEKVKHHYESHPQDNNHNNNNNRHDNNRENVMKTENVFDHEKLKSLSRQQKQKKNDYKDGLMKNIRKFLKHTFD
ncbi:hypothetical protein E3N88_15984 [Mikania micrantha]|uniref:DUF4408 domain-containing protein n=1 Tax=Mikania micrantha TaxID=192012 RepID=A0A5N6NX60_9ASTR|nr:hypothetical protein E3N88_15984 [Mikania micrantha]